MLRRLLPCALFLILAACGGSPTRPTPIPPSTITVSGTLTDTVSGAILSTFVQTVNSLPALVEVTAAGHLPRTARITSASPTVDLIPDAAPFDLGFYRQLVRNGLEEPGNLQPVRVLSQSPSIYMQTTGLKPSTVAAYEAAARAVIPALTGGRMSLVTWQTGDLARGDQNGWITVTLVSDEAANCGRATIGAAAGHIWMNTHPRCHRNGDIVSTVAVFRHEVGHTLGYWHIDGPGLMQTPTPDTADVSEAERYHGSIAYARSSGNTDVDQDTLAAAAGVIAVVAE